MVAKPLGEVAVREPEGEGEPDAVGMDLQRSEVEDDRYWLHSSPMVATTVVPLKGAREPPLGAPGLRVRTGNEPRHELASR